MTVDFKCEAVKYFNLIFVLIFCYFISNNGKKKNKSNKEKNIVLNKTKINP